MKTRALSLPLIAVKRHADQVPFPVEQLGGLKRCSLPMGPPGRKAWTSACKA